MKKINDRKKIMIAIILLAIELITVKCFLSGTTSNESLHNTLPQSIFFVLITVIMMLVPFVLYLLNKGRFEYKYGLTISLYNSLYIYVVAVTHPIITLILGQKASFKSFDIYISSWRLIILYTLTGLIFFIINMLLFTKSKNDKKTK